MGEPNDPYEIATAEDLLMLGETPEDYDKHFILTADIDMDPNLPGGKVFNRAVIASDNNDIESGFQGIPFAGVFEGSSHEIWNLTLHSNEISSIGLFGCIDRNAEIKNLSLKDPTIEAGAASSVGALCGRCEKGTITRCHVIGGTVIGDSSVGGLVGYISRGIINQSSSAASVIASSKVGGLVGGNAWSNGWGTIVYSCATGDVTGDHQVGGLVGQNSMFGAITDCYATGDVTGNTTVAGLVGHNTCRQSALGTVQRCYSIGRVTGLNSAGGLVCWNCGAVVSSFWDIQTSEIVESDGGAGRTTTQMQNADTFKAAGWDFIGPSDGLIDIWAIPDGGGYPVLWWQHSLPPEPAISSGTGRPEDPYLISTADELNSIRCNPSLMSAHFKLVNDIDMLDVSFFVIGNELFPFTGVFDGNGRKIYNLNLAFLNENNIGLFGYVDNPDARIMDVELISPHIDAQGGLYIGSLVGRLKAGIIDGCYAQDVNISGKYHVGGLVGQNYGAIVNCKASGSIMGKEYIGGLVGSKSRGNVMGCFSTGSVLGEEGAVGGLVGYNLSGGITFCYSQSSVHGDWQVGGLVGNNRDRITECFSTGAVSGENYVGGLVGYNGGGTISTSFWDIETSGQTTSPSGIGLATVGMQTARTFLDAGWDFVDETANGTEDIWCVLEGLDYPRLWWEKYAGGSGEPSDPYLIYTAEHLNEMSVEPNDWDKHFKLMADIDLSGYVYDRAVIAPDVGGDGFTFPATPFTGLFDGNGRAVLNLTIAGRSYLGLFGRLGPGAEVKGLGVVNVDITGSYYAVGGLVGDNRGSITACYSTGTVTGYTHVGGLVGLNYGDITASYSTCAASGNQKIGGLAGVNAGRIKTSYSTGAISGQRRVGGLVGLTTNQISACYSTGAVSGSTHVGGLVGERNESSGVVAVCFWDTETSGQTTSAGGTGLTTAEMQTATTFLDAGWDFVDETTNGTEDIWWILEGQDYPRLWWEPIPGN
jgi:hypothetical protein